MQKKKQSQKSADKEIQRVQVFYSGRVQGVGFRYTAEGFALELKLKGWVRNLPDGRVEMICEGPREKIEALFSRIKNSMLGPYIKKADVSWGPATNEFTDFIVEFFL